MNEEQRELVEARADLQATMGFLGAIAAGLEEAVGPTANKVAYLAGKKLGRRLSGDATRTSDLQQALASVREVLAHNDCVWLFEGFRPKSRAALIETDEDGDNIMLVFRDCMIRQSLFMFGHEQRGSLCTMMYGFFAGALEQIMGCESRLEIVHAGENACYKRLHVNRNQS